MYCFFVRFPEASPKAANLPYHGQMYAIAFLVLAVFLCWLSYRSLKRKRLIENVPSTKVLGITMGLNEVTGTVVCDSPLVSHISEQPCTWYRYTVEEYFQRVSSSSADDDDDGDESEEIDEDNEDNENEETVETDEGWERIEVGEEFCPFMLSDDTGAVRVVPDKAEFTGSRVLEARYERLPRSILDVNPLMNRRKPPKGALDLADRRADEKWDGGADRFELLSDDDRVFSSISRRHLKGGTGYYRVREYLIAPGDELYVLGSGRCREDIAEPEIAYDDVDDVLVLSVEGEAALASTHFWTAVAGFLGALGSLIAGAVMLEDAGKLPLSVPRDLVLLALVYLAGWAVLYGVLLYNGLVDVRHRVLRSWSMIDVQLKRRHDLIPRLADCVKGYVAHESEVQEAMAALRSGKKPRSADGMPSKAQVRKGGRRAVAQREAMTGLLAVSEAYPDLKASSVFQELHTSLIDTEDRIALARRFFNDSVTAYNDRIATVPDVFVAKFAQLTPALLYRVGKDESQSVSVDLS